MPIRLTCDNCGRRYNLKDELAGRKIRCQECSAILEVPAEEGVENYFADDEWGDGAESSFALPPVSGGGLPPRAKPGATRPASTTTTSRPKQQRRPEKSLPVLVIKIVAVVVGLVMLAILGKFGLDMSDKYQQRIAASQPDWRDYQVPGQPISIQMPGPPEPVNRVQNEILIQGAAFELQTLRGYSGGAFTVLYADNDMPLGTHFDLDDWFQSRRLRLMQANLSSMTSHIDERTISITDRGGNVHPGREYQLQGLITGREAKFTVRIYLVGDKAITATTAVGMKREREFQPHSSKFLDSLQITDSIPSVKARQKAEVRTMQQQPGRAQSAF